MTEKERRNLHDKEIFTVIQLFYTFVLLSAGEVVPAHQHKADVFAYVLDGSIITQLKGGKPQTVHTGEVFYESPTDIHVDSRNASKTQPAKLLVFFVKKIGASPTVAVAKAAH